MPLSAPNPGKLNLAATQVLADDTNAKRITCECINWIQALLNYRHKSDGSMAKFVSISGHLVIDENRGIWICLHCLVCLTLAPVLHFIFWALDSDIPI